MMHGPINTRFTFYL